VSPFRPIQYNHWDPRFSACSAPEEEWERSLPLNGDRVLCLVGATRWCEGVVRRVPSETQWVRHKQTEDEAWVVPLYNAVNNGEIRRSADCRELASAPRARRVRKAPVQYKAESCTALSRALRVTETEEVRRPTKQTKTARPPQAARHSPSLFDQPAYSFNLRRRFPRSSGRPRRESRTGWWSSNLAGRAILEG